MEEDVMPTELCRLSVQVGDLVRISTGLLYRVVDVSIGGTLSGVHPRSHYYYGRLTADVDPSDIIEWRAGPERRREPS
jgi:hypothetical protein